MSSSTLVGRDDELAGLQALLDRTVGGTGGTVVLVAEAGGGKTRLAREAATRAEAKGMVVVWGVGMEATSAVPLLPVVEAMNNALAPQHLDRLRSRLRPAHRLAALVVPELFPDVALPEHLEEAAKPMLFEAVLEIVGLLGDSALLVLDDAHWADSTTQQLLLHCTNRTPNRPLAVLITWRAGVEDDTLRAFERLGMARSLRLRPLSVADVAHLGAEVLGSTPSPELVATVTERSAGNPFAASELFSAAARGLLTDELPRSVREAVLGRARDLSELDERLLRSAAVCGGEPDTALLCEMTDEPKTEADASLRRLVGVGLLENLGRGRFAFRHALIAGAVLSEIEAGELARFHAAAAAALQARGAPRAEVAHHLFVAGRGAEAVPIAVAAAEEAERRGGYVEASSLYERAANASSDPAEVGRLLNKAAGSASLSVNPRRGRDLAAHAVKVLCEAGLPAGHARAIYGYSMTQLGQEDAGHAELLAAIEELELGGPSPELANALWLAGAFEMSAMIVEESLTHSERAVMIAEQVGDWRTAIGAKSAIAPVLGQIGHFDESVRLLDELIEQALAADIHHLAVVSTGNLSSALVTSLRGREAIAALARFDDPRFGELASLRHHIAAMTFTTVGYPVRALAEAEAATTAQGQWLTALAYMRARALVMLDRAAEALRSLESADAGTLPAGRSSQPPRLRLLAPLQPLAAITMHVAMGAVAAAADEAVRALDWEAPCFRYFAIVAEPAVEALLLAGRRDDAERGLAVWRSRADPDDPWWRLALARTEVDRDPEAAALSAQVSVEAFSEAGYAWDECRARRILAQALSAIGDRAGAIEQLQLSLGTAKERGIAYEARLAREGLAALGGQSDLPTPVSVRGILEQLDNASGDMRARLTALIEDLVAAGGRESEAGMILRDYYVKKVGSQEVVAERHYITRPTFYRRLHLGWELLASRLGPFDELPADSAQGRLGPARFTFPPGRHRRG